MTTSILKYLQTIKKNTQQHPTHIQPTQKPKFHPYDSTPVTLQIHQNKKIRETITNSQNLYEGQNDKYHVQRKQNKRRLFQKDLEMHYREIHTSYKKKQNMHLRAYQTMTGTNKKQRHPFEVLFLKRSAELKIMHMEYLNTIKEEIRKQREQKEAQDDGVEKLVNDYNIIYEYRAEKIKKVIELAE